MGRDPVAQKMESNLRGHPGRLQGAGRSFLLRCERVASAEEAAGDGSTGSARWGSAISRPTVSHKRGSCARPSDRIWRATSSSGLQNCPTIWEIGRPVRSASSRSVSMSSRGRLIESRSTSLSRLATAVLGGRGVAGSRPHESSRHDRGDVVSPAPFAARAPVRSVSGVPRSRAAYSSKLRSFVLLAMVVLLVYIGFAVYAVLTGVLRLPTQPHRNRRKSPKPEEKGRRPWGSSVR
jgi:hypothetical protein